MNKVTGGATVGEHEAAAMQRRSFKKSTAAVGPQLPVEVAYLWHWFEQVTRGRDAVFTPNPLTWAEIDAWSRLTRRRLSDFELNAIWTLDSAYLRIAREKTTT